MKAHRTQGAVVVAAGADPNDVPQLRLTADTAVLRPRRDVMVDVKFRLGGAATLMETTGQTPGGLVMSTTIWHAPVSPLTLGLLAELARDSSDDLDGATVLQLFLGTRGVPRMFRELVRFAFALP
jgi:hypothetical protein